MIVIGDCTGTDKEEEQSYAEKFIFPKIGTIVKSEEFLNAVD